MTQPNKPTKGLKGWAVVVRGSKDLVCPAPMALYDDDKIGNRYEIYSNPMSAKLEIASYGQPGYKIIPVLITPILPSKRSLKGK